VADHHVGRILSEEPTNKVAHSLDSPEATRPLATVGAVRRWLGDYLDARRKCRNGSHQLGFAEYECPDAVSLAKSGQQLECESLRATRAR
jgi:hypothetical protein